MKRVLIWKKVTPGSEYDLYHTVDSKKQIEQAIAVGGYNFGNRLWLQGLMSEIDTSENEYAFLNDDLTADIINSSFDFVIYPMANIFNKNYLHFIKSSAEQIADIKIPVYVIACGAQAESYDKLDTLVSQIGNESKRFIDAIYQTGGQFALRGHFTNEFFKYLGYNNAVVTGCPSLYQMGRDFKITKSATSCNNPAFNGNLAYISKLIDLYPNSFYYDQDSFITQLYNPSYINNDDFKYMLSFYCNCGPEAAKLLGDNRIKLIPEMCDWRSSIIENKCDYSFGSRIHGNIMAILSGVPATVIAIDSRTREMAEFYDIPLVIPNGISAFTKEEFLECYKNADFTKFNETYNQKYDAFEKFLIDNKIVSHINQNNRFFSQQCDGDSLTALNQNEFKKLSESIRRYKIPLTFCKWLLSVLR